MQSLGRKVSRAFAAIFLASSLCGFTACQMWPFHHKTVVVPAPADVRSAAPLGEATSAQASKAAAAVAAATDANTHNTDSPAKTAVAGELSVAGANLPIPSDKDRAEALARTNAALSGDLSKAQAGWDKARGDAVDLSKQISELRTQVTQERKDAAAQLTKEVSDARDEAKKEADATQRKIAAYIFYGGAFLLAAAAAVVLGTAAYVPMFGPKLAISLGISSAASVVLGTLVNELLSNPWIMRSLLGVLIAGVATAIGLAISNHIHHTATVPAPAKA